jgi:hypothetical protein
MTTESYEGELENLRRDKNELTDMLIATEKRLEQATGTPKKPRLWDWFWLADRTVGALEALVAGLFPNGEQEEQEQHQCKALFLGETRCHVCGKELTDEPGENDQEHQEGRITDHHQEDRRLADEEPQHGVDR